MKKIIPLIILVLFFPLSLKALGIRDQGEMSLGIVGGYGFPQLGYWGTSSIGNRMNKGYKEYSYGLLFDFFVLNNLALSSEITYTYNKIKLRQNDLNSYNWEGHFIDLSLSAHGYWFEFLYFGGGLYGRIPYHSPISNAPGLKNNIQFTLGALIEFGVDLKFFDSFGMRIGIRSHLPFMPYHSIKNNNYELWTFPINFVFGLEWVFN